MVSVRGLASCDKLQRKISRFIRIRLAELLIARYALGNFSFHAKHEPSYPFGTIPS